MFRIAACMIMAFASASVFAEEPWDIHTQGDLWRVATTPLLSFTCPGDVESQPPEWAEAKRILPVPQGYNSITLAFLYTDTFTGATAGYHFLVVAVDEKQVWEMDVAGGDLNMHEVHLDITDACRDKDEIEIMVQAENRKWITNFPVTIQVGKLALMDTSPSSTALPWRPLPPDLPLREVSLNGADWTSKAVVLQPWGKTVYDALNDCGDLPKILAEKHGFNAIIVPPPDAIRYTAPREYAVTEENFQEGLEAYRKAGYRIILYSSIMHIGHSAAWEEKQIAREHPDWAQRDPFGGVVEVYGAPWLCPSTPALDFAIDYARELVETYHPDAVMLDNNQFYKTANGVTCYCDSCQRAFCAYVSARFGSRTQEYFSISAEQISIPAEAGPLRNLWIHWRNRVWAEANERFREALREAKPDIMFFANTQYLHSDWLLASDIQVRHEDVILSESRSLGSWQMSAKMLLGQALAGARPVWNYIGTFEEKDLTRLREPEVVAPITAATIAHGANPWIVYYGFGADDERNIPSQKILHSILGFRDQHPELFQNLKPLKDVVTIISSRTRNYFDKPLIPSHVEPLLRQGMSLNCISDIDLNPESLSEVKTVIAEHTLCLEDTEANSLADWVRDGGTLLTTSDIGTCDSIGRERLNNIFAKQFNKEQLGDIDAADCDKGRVILVEADAIPSQQIFFNTVTFTPEAKGQIEVCAYKNPENDIVLHIVNHGDPIQSFWHLDLPQRFQTLQHVQVFLPEEPHESNASFESECRLVLPPINYYAVVVLTRESF